VNNKQLHKQKITAVQGPSRRIYALIFILLILGFSAFFFRFSYYNPSETGVGDTIWRLTIQVIFDAPEEPITLSVSQPLDTQYARVVAQKFYHPDMRIRRTGTIKDENKEILIRTNRAGLAELKAEYIVQVTQERSWKSASAKAVTLSADRREKLLQAEDEAINKEILSILFHMTRDGIDKSELLNRIFRYVHEKIVDDPSGHNNDIPSVLRTKRASVLGRARLMVALCRAANFPSRLVAGFILKEHLTPPLHFWIEVFHDDKWQPYGPTNGHTMELPVNYLPLKRDDSNIIKYPDTLKPTIFYRIEIDKDHHNLLKTDSRGLLDIVNFMRLPLTTRSVLAILLLLPLGVLVNTLFRHVIGIRTFGAVSPALLALSVIHAGWTAAFILATIVAAIGLTGRSVIPGKPERLPRFTMMITLVSLSMLLSISVMDFLQIEPEGETALLPVVVMTMLVDRVYTVTDESGVRIAMTRLFWTFIVGLICYFILQMELLGHYLLQYPELHFGTLALALLLGSYKGKKLSSLPFFKWLSEPRQYKAGSKKKFPQPENETTN
jgi:hypothetical protein